MPNIELMDKEVAELIEYIALYHSPNEDGTIVYNMDSTQEERFLDLIPGSLICGSPTTVTLLIGSYFEFLRTGNTKKVHVITKLSCGTSKLWCVFSVNIRCSKTFGNILFVMRNQRSAYLAIYYSAIDFTFGNSNYTLRMCQMKFIRPQTFPINFRDIR